MTGKEFLNALANRETDLLQVLLDLLEETEASPKAALDPRPERSDLQLDLRQEGATEAPSRQGDLGTLSRPETWPGSPVCRGGGTP